MKGHLRERSPGHWAIILDIRDAAGQRKRKWHSFKGTKREAQVKKAELIAAMSQGSYVERSKTMVADFVRGRVDQWEAASDISARTAQRYRQLLENQIAPHIGAKPVQKLTRLDVEGWHTVLRNAFCSIQRAPKVADTEKVVVRDVPAFIAAMRTSERFYVLAMIALLTGMRLSEILALRWNRVDLDAKVIRVREALEQTAAHGVRFKSAKSRAGRRDITLPDMLVDILREHRKAALQLRLHSALAGLRRMRCCSRTSRASRFRPTLRQAGSVSSPTISACPTSPSTFCGTPMPRN